MEELCGKSVSKSFVSSLTEELEPMVEWQNRLLSEKLSLNSDVLYIKVRERKSSTLKKLSYSDWNQRWRRELSAS